MTSANEHLPPPPKPKLSPLEFRNTDLVSRLLAATPPYLYNMSLLPNTYFFSEMLRSLVQAKAERNAAHSAAHPQVRRARKRHWGITPSYHQKSTLIEPPSETKPADPDEWMLKSNKKIQEENSDANTSNTARSEKLKTFDQSVCSTGYQQSKIEGRLPEHQLVSSAMQHHQSHNDATPQNLVLPPAPPIWYPPLYPPSPYGIDPLHFFIDLRVSGHIYDRKNGEQKEAVVNETVTKREDNLDDIKQERDSLSGIFRQSRHSSAFSVPVPSRKSQEAINLSEKETKPTKFDVKSMGFDKSSNKTSTNYVMSNITSIYKGINTATDENRMDDVHEEIEGMSEEEKEKKVRDLRTLIGLELAVNYMSPKPHCDSKENKNQNGGSLSSSDVESVGSPALEVVAIQDDN
ncbi:unnamed protein product [Callosobruchus maculatus]|uniref:Uncharacterized protein n=1 Tax=Callosobruchus maculatus TaxID=64391 RepID=A0A653C7L2_CALMS|nr:unnamed protein product [Callosobruchus maculatus]